MKLQAAWKRSGRYSTLTEEQMAALRKAKKALLEALRAYHIEESISHDVLEAVVNDYLNHIGARREDVDRTENKVRDEAGEGAVFSRRDALRQRYGR